MSLSQISDLKIIKRVNDLKVELNQTQDEMVNKKIELFTKRMSEKGQSVENYLEKRNAINKEKVMDDINLGKKCEFYAYLAMRKEYGFPVTSIDLEVRHGRNKGWDHDLPFQKVDEKFPNTHVKGCSQGTLDYCDDYSWTFQYRNNNGFCGQDSIFNDTNPSLVAFVFTENFKSNIGIVKAILPWSDVRKYLRNPKKRDHAGIKQCIYYKDLVANKHILEN